MANKLITNFGGGINSQVSPLIIDDSEAELVLNYALDEIGSLTKRNGYDVFASQPNADKEVLGLSQYTNTGSPAETTQVMVANNSGDTNAVIYYNNSGTWTSSKSNDTAVSTVNNSKRVRFVTFLDYLFRVNGQDVVATSNDVNGGTWGTTNAPSTIIPSFVEVYEDRVYAANDQRSGSDRHGSRVYFSALPSGGTISWTIADDWFDVNPDDGDEITALENNGNRLLIFKKRALYRWKFGSVEPDRLIGVGTESQESVATNFDLGITFFANKIGVYSYSGGRPKLISRKIQKWFDALSSSDVSGMAGGVDDNHYYLYLSDSLTVGDRTYANVMAVYHISLDSWTIYTLNTPVRMFGRLIQSGIEDLYFGSDNGRTYHWNQGNSDDSGGGSSDTAVPILAEILTKNYTLDFPEKVSVNGIDVIARQGQQSSVQAIYDRKDDSVSLGSLKEDFSHFSGKKEGKNIHTAQLRITDNSHVKSIIEGVNFNFNPKKYSNG